MAPCKPIIPILIFLTFVSNVAFSAECENPPAKKMSLDPLSNGSLLSPDQRWQFVSVPKSMEHKAALYIQNVRGSQKWNVGSIERHGDVFWSKDSKRLFLRDAYAADDTKIRAFGLSGPVPEEVTGLDRKMRMAIFAHIPKNKATLWLYYPEVCFAANDSSTIIAIADAPLVPKKESGSGSPFSLKLTVNLTTLEILVSGSARDITQPESLSAGATPLGWQKVDAGPFSVLAPSGWTFHQLPGVDSFVGEFVGDGMALRFDFGEYSGGYLKKARKPAYVIAHESIGGFSARIASPTIPGHGHTGIYFPNVGHSNGLFLWGNDLTAGQQELALKIFKTVRFGGPMPRYVLPPPPAKDTQ